MTPAVVIRPTWLRDASVNHNAPSGPVMMACGALPAVGRANSVTTPAIVIRPTLLPACSVNHSAPSGPAVIPWGPLSVVGMANSVVAGEEWQIRTRLVRGTAGNR